MTMGSTAFKDFIGDWQLLLVGLLLSVSPVLEATTATPPAGTATSSGPVTTIAGSTVAGTTIAGTTIAGASTAAATTLLPSTSPAAQTTAANTQTQSPSQAPTSAAAPVSPTATAAMTSVAPTAITATGSTSQPMSTSTGAVSTSSPITVSSSVTSSSMMTSSMSTAGMGNTNGSWSNGTSAGSNSSMSTISCRSFLCNYSDCYSMYMGQNASMCPYGYNYCELMKLTGIGYSVSCSASCSMSCGNTTQSNCSVNCCNSTNCLNDTFASMMMTTSTPMMTTTTRATTPSTTTTTTTAPTTQAGKVCDTGKCNGATCYKNLNLTEVCTSSQPHCELKKETVGSTVQWTAGCTTNCSGQTPCKAATQPPCHLECCNATLISSCLLRNGTLVPSVATRGPQLHSELFASVLCVFVISLML